MARAVAAATAPKPARVRCAVYTRKSTEEGLDQEFNSLDAQREAAEAYIASQRHEGWECLPARYDDGGFSGGNLERPALTRLLADIEAGRIDAVVVYKVDRLSRSLFDFAKMVGVFDKHRVAFVSVTQQFNTSTSMGRLVLNVLLSFAQFEREIIAERTRDKMAAARRKGKWVGGRPPLGYDIDARGRRLVVNDAEAALVREAFRLYLEERSTLRVAEILNGRGERLKAWTTRAETRAGGTPWDKGAVHRLLSNVAYVGKVAYRGEVFAGEQPPLIEPHVFDAVQTALAAGRCDRAGAGPRRDTFLLRGLVRCAACGSVMTSSTAVGNGRRFRYYRCTVTHRRGAQACAVRSVSAPKLEQFVVERVRELARDPSLVAPVVARVRADVETDAAALRAERAKLGTDLARARDEARRLVAAIAAGDGPADRFTTARLGELEQQAGQLERRATDVDARIAAAEREAIREEDIHRALRAFDPVWDALTPRERVRVVRLLIAGITYDGRTGQLAVTFHPPGVAALADAAPTREARA